MYDVCVCVHDVCVRVCVCVHVTIVSWSRLDVKKYQKNLVKTSMMCVAHRPDSVNLSPTFV